MSTHNLNPANRFKILLMMERIKRRRSIESARRKNVAGGHIFGRAAPFFLRFRCLSGTFMALSWGGRPEMAVALHPGAIIMPCVLPFTPICSWPEFCKSCSSAQAPALVQGLENNASSRCEAFRGGKVVPPAMGTSLAGNYPPPPACGRPKIQMRGTLKARQWGWMH